MCIRDRYKVVASPQTPNGLVSKFTLPIAWVDPASYESNKLCLLYTSDAADERSSVDLGGRRIIKKKKNKIISLYSESSKKKAR